MSEAVVRKVIKTIPATRDRYTATSIKAETKRRVAAYARVSTDDEEQQTSYEHQVTHYTQYIQEHEGWLFAGMFTDEERSYPALLDGMERDKMDRLTTA